MDPIEQYLIEALDGQKISECSDEELGHFSSGQIAQCYIMLGYQTYNSKDISVLATKLASDLRMSYAFLTKEEVSFCFENGAKGVYGDFQGVNLRTLTRWLKSYKMSDLRYRAVVARQKEMAQKALPEVSDTYKDERELAFLRNVFLQYRDGYPLERLYPSYVYQTMQRRGLVCHTPEEKRAAMDLFAGYRPSNRLPMHEDVRQSIIRSKAMEWLLRKEFDRWIRDGRKEAA